MNKNNIVKWTIITGLWSVLLVPFIVANHMFFPYITGKNFTFRIIIEIIFVLWVYLAFVDAKYRPKFSWISVSVGSFVLIMAIADIFAVNPLKAVWSNYERMDGLVTLLHLIMYLFVFGSVMKSKQNWIWFFRSSVIASMGMIIFVLQEWLKTGVDRVSVTLGNPIYVAVYFLFNFFFTLILLYQDVLIKSENTSKPIKTIFSNWLTYVYFLAAFICVFGIWRTSTRGVILGLLGGLIVTSMIIAFFEKKNILIKKSSIGLLFIIALLIGGFFAVKNTQFVKNNLTLNRLAGISWSNVAGQGQARQYVWPMAIKGYLERPILGWGQDGFNNIFNKYYDPRMYNQEQWFDRAHNTPLDILVAGGTLGLLAYLSIFVAAIFVVFRKKNNFEITEVGLIVGLLAAYFAQNLFVFDNLISYVFFYVILAYLYFRDTQEAPSSSKVIESDVVNYMAVPVLVIVFSLSLWYCNIKPLNANLNIIKSLQSLNAYPETSLNLFQNIFSAKTFGSPEAREQIINIAPSVASASNIDTKLKQEFVDTAFIQIQEQVRETPEDARYQFFAGVFLDKMSQYQMALPYLQKAVELSPKKLTMLFELTKCYSYLGQKDKALEIAKFAYDLTPEYNEAKYNYAAALIINNKELQAKELVGSTNVTSESVVRAYLIRASDFIQKGDKNSAILEIKKAIDLAPVFKSQGDSIIKEILEGKMI